MEWNMRPAAAGSSPLTGYRPALVLMPPDVAAVLDWPSVVAAVEESHRMLASGAVANGQESRVDLPNGSAWLRVFSAAREAAYLGSLTFVAGTGRSATPPRLAVLYHADGSVHAIVDAQRTSWMRAGATAAVAARHLGPAAARTFGIIGTGRLARAIVLACASVFEDAVFLAYGRDPHRAREFADEMSHRTGRRVNVLGSAEAVARASDVLTTATTSATPVVRGEAVPAGAHVTAMGAHSPDRREVDTGLVVASRLFVDDRARALTADGDLLQPVVDGLITQSHVVATLGEVIAGRATSRRTAAETTLFSSGGLASEHLAVVALAVERAHQSGLGTGLDLRPDDTLPGRQLSPD